MSDVKFKYFEITKTAVVRANNKSDAEAVASGRRGVSGSTLASEVSVTQLSAPEARELASEML